VSSITDKTQYPNNQQDVFASFIEKQKRYAANAAGASNKAGTAGATGTANTPPPANTKVKVQQQSGFKGYIQELKNPHSTEFKATVAGAVTAVLGGVSVIVGRKNMGTINDKLDVAIKWLRKKAESQSGDSLAEAGEKILTKAKSMLEGIYAIDKVKDTTFLKVLRGMDDAVCKGLNTIGLKALSSRIKPYLPGHLIEKASKLSLNATARSLRRRYKGAGAALRDAEKTIAKNWNNLTPEEKEALRPIKELLEEKKLQEALEEVVSKPKIKDRLKKLSEKIDEDIMDGYLKDYFPNVPKNPFSLSAWRQQFSKAYGNWKRAAENGKADVLRENWDETERKLQEHLLGPINNRNSFGKVRTDYRFRMSDLETFETTADVNGHKLSAAFSKIYKDLRGARDKLESAIRFEVDGEGRSYAGRAIDLAAGGGIPEVLIPIVTGAAIMGHTLKKSKEEDGIKEKLGNFMRKGGFEFLGSLSSWFVVAVMLGNNGPPAIIASLTSAVLLNIAKKTYYKFTGKELQTLPDEITNYAGEEIRNIPEAVNNEVKKTKIKVKKAKEQAAKSVKTPQKPNMQTFFNKINTPVENS